MHSKNQNSLHSVEYGKLPTYPIAIRYQKLRILCLGFVILANLHDLIFFLKKKGGEGFSGLICYCN